MKENSSEGLKVKCSVWWQISFIFHFIFQSRLTIKITFELHDDVLQYIKKTHQIIFSQATCNMFMVIER